MISPYFACPAFRSKNLAGAAGCLVALAFSGIASAAEALPQLVLPGRGAVDGRRIVPYDNAWSVVQQKPDGTIVHVGVATDHVARVMLEGKSYLLRIEGEIDDDGSPSDTSVTLSDPVTLAPHSGAHYASNGSVTKRSYDGLHLTIRKKTKPGDAEQIKKFDFDGPVFDFRGNLAGLLLRAQPLAAGYTARVPWADEQGTVHTTPVRVLRRETVTAGMLGAIATWVVAIGADTTAMNYWIADRPPYVIKCIIATPGGTTSWDMVR